MSSVRFLVHLSCVGLLLIGAAACTSVRYGGPPAKHKGHGPPPHAPAHGYRAKTADGVDIHYDDNLGVYLVVGVRDVFFWDGLYYRFGGNRWSIGHHPGGPWQEIGEGKVPPGLRSKYPHHRKHPHKSQRKH